MLESGTVMNGPRRKRWDLRAKYHLLSVPAWCLEVGLPASHLVCWAHCSHHDLSFLFALQGWSVKSHCLDRWSDSLCLFLILQGTKFCLCTYWLLWSSTYHLSVNFHHPLFDNIDEVDAPRPMVLTIISLIFLLRALDNLETLHHGHEFKSYPLIQSINSNPFHWAEKTKELFFNLVNGKLGLANRNHQQVAKCSLVLWFLAI